MSHGFSQQPITHYPRITIHCGRCGNEFNISVIRFRDRLSVDCQVCGQIFPEDLGHAFAQTLNEMFTIKHNLEHSGADFEVSFVYKSTFKQPPAPLPFTIEDFNPPDDPLLR